MFSPKDPCQSCGMPLSKDPQKGGTKSDGTKSTDYSSYCYQNGSFTEPDITVQDMIKKVDAKLRGMWILFHWEILHERYSEPQALEIAHSSNWVLIRPPNEANLGTIAS